MEKLPRKRWLDQQGVDTRSLEKLGRPKQMQAIRSPWPYCLQCKLWLASCQISWIGSCCLWQHFMAVGICSWTREWSREHENIWHFLERVLQAAWDFFQIYFLLVHSHVLQQERHQAQRQGSTSESTGLASPAVLAGEAQSQCCSSMPNLGIPEAQCATGNYFRLPQRRFIFGTFSCNLKLWSSKILHHSLHFVPGLRYPNFETPFVASKDLKKPINSNIRLSQWHTCTIYFNNTSKMKMWQRACGRSLASCIGCVTQLWHLLGLVQGLPGASKVKTLWDAVKSWLPPALQATRSQEASTRCFNTTG